MFFPEVLYILSEKDRHSTFLDPTFSRNVVAGALVTLTATYAVPSDRAFMLQNVHGLGDPGGAGQDCQQLSIYVQDPDASIVVTLITDSYGAGAVNRFLTWTGDLLIPPSWSINLQGVFLAAGPPNNSITIGVAGALIPVANIQR